MQTKYNNTLTANSGNTVVKEELNYLNDGSNQNRDNQDVVSVSIKNKYVYTVGFYDGTVPTPSSTEASVLGFVTNAGSGIRPALCLE